MHCVKSGNCIYNDYSRSGENVCFFPEDCCPFDLLDSPPQNMNKYREQLAIAISTLSDRTFITNMEKERIMGLRAALAASYQKK